MFEKVLFKGLEIFEEGLKNIPENWRRGKGPGLARRGSRRVGEVGEDRHWGRTDAEAWELGEV